MEDAIRKADVLIEALPYLRSYRGRIFVIKLGGAAMEERQMLDDLLQDIVFLATVGIKPVLVHGGGPDISRAMKERGLKPNFINGHRVTDQATLDVAKEVLGKINADLVRRLRLLHAEAEGFADMPAGTVMATRKIMKEAQANGPEKQYDLGLVGDVKGIDVPFFNRLIDEGTIPVVAPIAQGSRGELLNCNADTVASFIAATLHAEKVVFLSDTHGILADPNDDKSLVSSLTEEGVAKLIKDGIITGGMLPKVYSCLNALTGGVRKAHIVDGRIAHCVLLEIFTDRGAGTQILK
jgi:acetylglutamate kinase